MNGNPGQNCNPDCDDALQEESSIQPVSFRDSDLPLESGASGRADPEAAWGLVRSDRLVLLLLCGVVFLLLLTNLVRLRSQSTPAIEVRRLPEHRLDFQIDMNRATWVEWMQLPEIGETTARQIVADREARGDFHSIEDLRRVRGIGPLTMYKIRPYLQLNSADK